MKGRIAGVLALVLVVACGGSTGSSGAGGNGGSAGAGGNAAGGHSGAAGGSSGAAGTGQTAGTGGSANGGHSGAGGSAGVGGSAAGGGGAGGSSAGAGAGGQGADCPTTLPATGSCPASLEGRLCTYGDAPRSECRDHARCSGGQWAVTHSQCATPSPPAQCPSQPPTGTVACSTPNRDCTYSSGAECTCLGATSSTWVCNPAPTPGANCPALIPNAGTSCTATASCSYPCGPLSTNSVNAMCGASGLWQWVEAPCSTTGG